MSNFKGLRLSACRSLGVIFLLGGLAWSEEATMPSPADMTAPATEDLPVEVSSAPARVPFVAPLGVKSLKVLSGFGKRTLPPTLAAAATSQLEIKFYEKSHEGVDYAATAGMPVLAAKSGKVLFAGFSKAYASRKNKNDQTRLIIISHPDGMSTRYVHLSTLKVRPQSEVKAGQTIGNVSGSDEWTQPVLHFEIRDVRGQALDPIQTMAEFAAPETSVTP